MLVKQVQLKKKLSQREFIRVQLQLYCTLLDQVLTETNLDTLQELAVLVELDISRFCRHLCNTESSWFKREVIKDSKLADVKYQFIYSSEQSARNQISKLIEQGLIRKYRKHTIKLSKDLEILIEQGTLLNLQLLCYETTES